MNPLLEEIFAKQVRSLGWIYFAILACVIGALITSIILTPREASWSQTPGLFWVEIGLVVMSALVLGLALPIAYRKLTSIEKVLSASPKLLADWGLPETFQPSVGRQAVYLTRYTAGCILSWTMAASVGLYGLVACMLGAGFLWTGSFFAASLTVMAFMRPRAAKLRKIMDKLADQRQNEVF